MTGPAHYREAERLLADLEETPELFGEGEAAEYARQQLTAAQVHATLALAAATATGWSAQTSQEWLDELDGGPEATP